MINSEQAYDMLGPAGSMMEKLNMIKFKSDLSKKHKGEKVDLEAVGLEGFQYIMKNSKLVKDEVFEIVAIGCDKPLEEVKAQPPGTTIKMFKEIFLDPEMMAFFKTAMQ